MNKKTLGIILANSALLAAGIMLILISCIQYSNAWPLLTIFVDIVAIVFTAFCDGCAMESSTDEYSWIEEDTVTPASFAWIIRGFFVTAGYAIPVELFRVKVLQERGLYFTLGGSTTILVSALIFVRVVYYNNHSEEFATLF